jgi:oligosaccharide repeat unit polymerase
VTAASKFVGALMIVGLLSAAVAFPQWALPASLAAFVFTWRVSSKSGLIAIRSPALIFAGISVLLLVAYQIAVYVLLGGSGTEEGAFSLPVFLPDRASQAIQATAICVLSMLLGSFFALTTVTRATPPEISIKAASTHYLRFYALLAAVPLLANIVLYVLVFARQTYIDIHVAGFGPLKYVLFSVYLSFGATLLMLLISVSTRLRKAQRYVVAAVLLLWLITYGALYGTRSSLFMLLMLYLYVYSAKLRRSLIALLAIVASLLFLVMALFRQDAFVQPGLPALLSELLGLGGFVDNVAYALNTVAEQGVAYGATYLRVLWDISYSPGDAYSYEFAPQFAEQGGGFGFFYVAELILNFGTTGAAMVCGIAGYLLTRLALSTNPKLYWIVNPAIVATSFPLMRNEFSTSGKSLLYVLLGTGVAYVIARIAQLASHPPVAVSRDPALQSGGAL